MKSTQLIGNIGLALSLTILMGCGGAKPKDHRQVIEPEVVSYYRQLGGQPQSTESLVFKVILREEMPELRCDSLDINGKAFPVEVKQDVALLTLSVHGQDIPEPKDVSLRCQNEQWVLQIDQFRELAPRYMPASKP